MTDEALLAGIAEGDADATAALVRRYQRRVYGLARAILGDPQAAEDVAQEAFVRVLRAAASYDARRGPVGPWLLTITRNLAIDSQRMRRAEPVDPDTIVALQPPDSSALPEDRAIAADDAAMVRAALRSLPVEQRRALVRAAFLGQTAREVAAHEGIPLGTAKTRIRSGLHKLAAALPDDAWAP